MKKPEVENLVTLCLKKNNNSGGVTPDTEPTNTVEIFSFRERWNVHLYRWKFTLSAKENKLISPRLYLLRQYIYIAASTQYHELEVSCSAASASGLPFTAQHWGKAQVWYRDLYAAPWAWGRLHYSSTSVLPLHNYAKIGENKRNLLDSADIFNIIFFSFGRIYGGDLAGTPTDQATLILSPI